MILILGLTGCIQTYPNKQIVKQALTIFYNIFFTKFKTPEKARFFWLYVAKSFKKQ